MTGFVYAIGDGNGCVKIGWSADPLRRLAKLRSDCPTAAELLGVVPATRTQEAEAHALLSPWHLNREWFSLVGPVAAFVGMLSQPRPRRLREADYLQPARGIIDRLGGVDIVAEVVGKHRTRVYRWMYPIERGGTGGLIPQRQHPKLLEYAERLNIELFPASFVQRTPSVSSAIFTHPSVS